jgi:hypothetical protein
MGVGCSKDSLTVSFPHNDGAYDFFLFGASLGREMDQTIYCINMW